MLNKSICRSRKFHELTDDTCRLLATWIISHLDKRGVYHGDPAIVKSYVFPRRSDVTVEDVDHYLEEMQRVGLLVRFDARQDQWQWWPGFLDEQVGLRAERETTKFPPPPDELPEGWGEHSGNNPDACRKDAGKKPAEEKLSEENTIEENTMGADAPDNPLPHHLNGWLDFIREGKGAPGGRTARLGQMLVTLWPKRYEGLDPPYSKIGGVARNVGGASRLAHLLWQANAYKVTGDPLEYCSKMHKNSRKRGGNGKNQRNNRKGQSRRYTADDIPEITEEQLKAEGYNEAERKWLLDGEGPDPWAEGAADGGEVA